MQTERDLRRSLVPISCSKQGQTRLLRALIQLGLKNQQQWRGTAEPALGDCCQVPPKSPALQAE